MVERMNGHVNEEGGGFTKSSNNKSSNLKISDDNICRDFVRHVCRRGKRCKFRHPEDPEMDVITGSNSKPSLTFCHDHQNGICSRSICRFIHCTCEEEDFYLQTNNIPPHILDQAIWKGQITDPTLNGDVPICKDFLLGECSRRRGGKCKFRHLSQTEYDEEVYGKTRQYTESAQTPYKLNENSSDSVAPPNAKRPRFDAPPRLNNFNRNDLVRPIDDVPINDVHVGRDISLREYRERDWERDRERERDRDREWERDLERDRDRRGVDEIIMFRKKIDSLENEVLSLKKENSDLRATNDFLLDKVTTIGLSKAGASVTTVTVPTVSMAATIPVATSIQSLTATQVSHPLSISSDMSVGSVVTLPPSLAPPRPPPRAQAAPQSLAPPTQQVAVATPQSAVVGSVGCVVSLSQAPALNAVSLSTVNLNPSIASATSMAPSIAPPPRTAQSLAQAISLSGASGHLVTYPIMTQPGLRPQIQ